MACPVNHPFFHALVFLLGIIVVLSRYARAADAFTAPLAAGASSALLTDWAPAGCALLDSNCL